MPSILLGGHGGESGSLLIGPQLQVDLLSSGRESAQKAVSSGDALNSVGRVEVLLQNNLEACGTSLAGDDGGVGKEELPDLLYPSVSIWCHSISEFDREARTRNHLLPYLASTLSRLAIQLRYHLQRVAE